MTMTSLHIFDETIQKSEQWVRDIESYLETDDQRHAYSALRSVLHALRDRLSVGEAIDLAAQLPLLIKGVYFDGWSPSKQPVDLDNREEFINYVRERINDNVDPQKAVICVFRALQEHVTEGEIRHVKDNLPQPIRALWPSSAERGL